MSALPPKADIRGGAAKCLLLTQSGHSRLSNRAIGTPKILQNSSQVHAIRVSREAVEQTEDGWWLLRASDKQAALVARCESATPKGLERLKGQLRAQLEASGLALPDR